MKDFKADGQLNPALIEARDRRLGVSYEAQRGDLAGIPMLSVEAGANVREGRRSGQMRIMEVEVSGQG